MFPGTQWQNCHSSACPHHKLARMMWMPGRSDSTGMVVSSVMLQNDGLETGVGTGKEKKLFRKVLINEEDKDEELQEQGTKRRMKPR